MKEINRILAIYDQIDHAQRKVAFSVAQLVQAYGSGITLCSRDNQLNIGILGPSLCPF